MTDPAPPPRVWLLVGDKLGDNAQARALADALEERLGWRHETRRVLPKPEWVLGKPRFVAGLHHLDEARSDALEPPWPDILITIGRRPAMAALWVAERSGGRTRIVLIGRPKRWIERFALVVVPGQFQVPDRGNVAHLALPLMRADRAAVAEAAGAWRDRLAGLPRPLTAVLVGGETKPYRFDAAVARRLLGELRALKERDGGTLYLTTSRRTRPEVVEALAGALPEGAVLHRWAPETAGENPYLGLLGLADRFVVTGDSVSMMVEVASLGRPLAIFALPVAPGAANRLRAGAAGLLARQGRGRIAGGLVHLASRLGAAGYARDITAIHRLLYRRGLAVPLGAEPFREPGGGLEDELAAVVERVRGLAPGA